MATKKIIINRETVMYGTNVKVSPKTSTSTTNTFDGPITQGLEKVAWGIDFGKVRYEKSTSHRRLSEILDRLMYEPGEVTIIDEVVTPTESYTIRDTFFGCILEGNDYEIKPDDNTVENIKMTGSNRDRKYE